MAGNNDYINTIGFGNIGTVADFSNWEGIKTEGNFRHVKEVLKDNGEINLNKAKENKKNFKKVGAFQEEVLDPNELKLLAIKLLPTVNDVPEDQYSVISGKAIDFAFAFLKEWNNKIELL